MEIVMNVELEWDFANPEMRRYVDGFQITPLLDRVSGNRDVNLIHIKQRTGADTLAEMQTWQGRPIDYRLFVILRHQDVEAILEAEMLVFALMEKIKLDLEEYLQTVRKPGALRLIYSNNRITCGVCHVSRQSSLKDFKLHVRSHIGDTTYYPPVQYKPPVARRPEPLATQASRPARVSAPVPRYDYESLISQSSRPSGGYGGEQQRRKSSLDYEQLMRGNREPSWEGGAMGRGRFDDDDDQWGGARSGGRSRSPQRRGRSFRRRSRSPSDEDHYTYRKRRRRSRSGSYDSAERKRMREALYMGHSRSRSRSRSPEWSGSASRKRPGSPYQSRYEKEMKKKPVRPYEAQAQLIQEMLDNASKASASPGRKMQQEAQEPMSKKQRRMQSQKGRKGEDWISEDTLWMQDVSGVMSKRGGRKGMGDSSGNITPMNINLGEEHMSMADAAAWYAKQRMMGMQQQQQQQMSQFGGMGQYGPGGGVPGLMGTGPGLYPSLMGMIRGPGGFQAGGGPMGMGRGMGGMGIGRGMGGMGMGQNFPRGGGGAFGGPGNFGGGGPMQGRRQQAPKVSKTPKAPETPIKLELRPGFVTDIMLSEPRESSPTTGESEATAPKVTVDKVIDPMKDEDPIGARYWKGMPPKPASAKSTAEDSETILPELQEEKKDAHPIPSTFDYKLRYTDLKTSAEVLLKKVPTMTTESLKTALGNIGKDVEPEIMNEIREKHKEAIEKLKEDKYWLYTAQYEDVLNRSRQLGKLFCEYIVSDKYQVPESLPGDGMDVLKLIMSKSDELSAEAKVDKMEQFFTALLKQKDTSDVSDEFWDERIKLLKESCGFSDPGHSNYIMKRVNQLQESVVKRTKEIPPTKEAQSMELNVIYAMVNEVLRQESSIETIDSRLDMRSSVRKHRKSEKLKTLQDDAKLKAEMWTLERQAEDGTEEEEDDEDEEEGEKEKEKVKEEEKKKEVKEEIKENGKDEEEGEGDKDAQKEEKEGEAKENGKGEEEKEKDDTEEKEKDTAEKEKPEKKEKVVEKIHPVIDDHPVAISKESRRLWKLLPKVPADGEFNLDECKELLEFLYENSPEDLYLREVLSNYSWKKQVAAIEAIHDVPGMRYVCKDCGSGWFVFENCLTHSLICKKELALVCPMCPEPHIMDARNLWRYIQHIKKHQEDMEKFVEKVEKADAEEKERIRKEEEAKAKAEAEAKAKAEAEAKAEEEAKAKAEKEAKEKAEKGDTEEEMETKEEEDSKDQKEEEKEESKKEEEKMDEKETEEVKDESEKEDKKDDEKEKEEKTETMEVDKEKAEGEDKTEKEEEEKKEEMEVESEESEDEEEEDDKELDLPPMFASLRKSAGEILNDLESMRLNQLESVLAVIKRMMKPDTMEIIADQIEKDIQKDIRRETKKKSTTIMNKYSDATNRCRAYIKVACKYIRKLRPGDEFQVKSIKDMDTETKAEEKSKQAEETAKQAEEEADKTEEEIWAEYVKTKEEVTKRKAEAAKRKEEKRKALEKKKKEAEAKRKAEEKKKQEEEKKRKLEEEKKKKEEEKKKAEEEKKKEEETKEGEEKEEAKEGEEKKEEGMEVEEKQEGEKVKEEKEKEVDEEAKDKETDVDMEGKAKEETKEEEEEEPMEEEEEEEEEEEIEEPELPRAMPWTRIKAVKRSPSTLKTEQEYYAMKAAAQKAKDEMDAMNTYKMDLMLNNFNSYLHHIDLRNVASLMRVESHREREKVITDPLHQLKLSLKVTLDYILNLLPDAHEGFEHFRDFLNPETKLKIEERFFRIDKFFLETFRHLNETKHSYTFWHARVQTIRKAMKLTDTKRAKHRLYVSRKRNFMQEEELFALGRNLTEMEAVMIQLKVHCEVALAIEKETMEKLNDELNFAKKDMISNEEEVAALTKEKEEFQADMQKFEDLLCNQDKSSQIEGDLSEKEKITFASKHGIWWRGLLYDPVPQNVSRIPLTGQLAMFHNLMKDLPVSWLSFITMASRVNKKDLSTWLEGMKKTTDGHYVCGKCDYGFRRLMTGIFHRLLCGKSGWTFCAFCKTDLQTESMYWFDRHMERHMKQAESAYEQCGKPEITLGFTLNELVQMLVNSASVILKVRQCQKKPEDTTPEVQCPSTEEMFNKAKETIKNILNDLDDLTNGELCDLGVQLRKAVGIKAMEDIREIVTECIESGRRSPDWNPANDKYFKNSEARLSLTLKVGYDYMMNLEDHDTTKSKDVVKEKTSKQYVEEHYSTDEEMLIVMYQQAVTCMRVLDKLTPPVLMYLEGKFGDIMRSDSTAEIGIVCQQEMERLKKEKASEEARDPTRINLKATCVYVLNMDEIEKKKGSDVSLPAKPNNSEERFLVLKKIASHTLDNMSTIPPERLHVVLQRIKGSLGTNTLEDIESKIKEEIEKEKETPEWKEDKYEDLVNKLKLDFKMYATYYTNIPYPDPYEDIERLKETWKPAKEVKADTKLQIAKEIFTMLLKQKRDSKLGEDYWNERIKAVIKCIGVVSSQEYYNPHYTWIRHNQSEEQQALKLGRYPTESEATIQHLKVLYAQVTRVIKKELTPGNVMEDLDKRPVSRKTINTPNLDLLKEKFIKWAKEVLDGTVEEQNLPNSFEELQEIDKGEMELEMQPINFGDYRKTYKMVKLEAPNDSLMKKVIKAAADLLKDTNKLEETVGKIEFVDEGAYHDIEKRAETEEATDKHKARLVDISIEKYVEGHYVCGTCGAGFMMFDNCVLHSLICGLEKLVVKCDWCSVPFSFKQYNTYLYRYQRHMEKHHQDLYNFIQATEKLPPNPDAPVEEPEEKKEEESTEKVKEEEEEKKSADAEKDVKEEKAEDDTEKSDVKEEKMDDAETAEKKEGETEEKLEEELLSGGDEGKDVKEEDEEKLLAESMDTSAEDLNVSVAEEAKESADEAAKAEEPKEEPAAAAEVEEEKPKPRPQRATRGRKRGRKS